MLIRKSMSRAFVYLNLLALLAFAPLVVEAQTRVKPGMNFFSLQQDVQIGRQSAAQVERQMRTYNDARVTRIGKRLARSSSMPGLPWRFRVVDSNQINAFALPGGFVYVNRGLLRAARNDSELAGVLAHEITHITLRHGTNQASKAMLAQAPLSILDGLLGNGGLGSTLARFGIGMGLNSVFLKFSRTAETQADVAGMQLMARSGYDPNGMISFFHTLQRQGRSGPEFLSDHPNPANRIARLQQEAQMLRGGRRAPRRR